MIRRRLYLQIYFTIISALALTVALTGLAFTFLYEQNRPSEIAVALAHRAVAMALPPAGFPEAEQVAVLEVIAADLDIDLALFDASGGLVAFVGAEPAARPTDTVGAFEQRAGAGDAMQLPDGRWIVAHVPFPGGGGLSALPLMLACVALAIAIASYPLVRRLTGRLERLQASVERMGGGDLAARAPVEGRDEIAGLAQSFNGAAAKIEALVDAHRALLADTSHELRTPLSRIRLELEMFHRTADAQRLVDVEDDITQLDTLIDEILTLSRLDAAPIQPEPGIDLLGVAAEECARSGIEAHAGAGGLGALVTGDRELLLRLIRNLVSNAKKHGEPPVEVEVAADRDTVTLTVRDGGGGIDPADRERVFKRFHRGPDRQHVNGYGLGLPLVRRIAEAHGGAVKIASGAVSTFYVSLPRSMIRTL